MGTVTATASLHDSTGRRETAQVSASTSDQTPKVEPSAPTPSEQPLPPTSQPTPSQPPPSQPPPSQPPPSQPPPMQPNTADTTPATAKNPPTQKEDEEEEEDQESREEQREKIQEYRNQKSIRGHVKNAYNCLQYADKVLLRYKVSCTVHHTTPTVTILTPCRKHQIELLV